MSSISRCNVSFKTLSGTLDGHDDVYRMNSQWDSHTLQPYINNPLL